jgi:hypothetical protein
MYDILSTSSWSPAKSDYALMMCLFSFCKSYSSQLTAYEGGDKISVVKLDAVNLSRGGEHAYRLHFKDYNYDTYQGCLEKKRLECLGSTPVKNVSWHV